MARIIVENYKRAGAADEELHVEAVIHKSPTGVAKSLKRTLAAAKAMWPDDEKLSKIHIVELP